MEVAAAGLGSLDDHQMVDHVMGMMSPAGSAVSAVGSEDEGDLRRGPWTVDEDVLLVNYIAKHGEGRWNSLARSAGLKRTGKSCRLRWLNYLRPDVRRGNITPEEQLLILELHSRWGNRWSKIAQHLPGRTDNEIKNYWRTRVQKHARQLRCDVNSRQFRDVVRHVWMPRLVERIQAAATAAAGEEDEERGVAAAGTAVSAPAALCQRSAYGAAVLPPKGNNLADDDHYNHHRHLDYYCYNEPSQQTMSPDDASSALRSSLTADASSHAHHHHHHLASASATATPTNEGAGAVQCGATGGGQQDEDVFGGSWSELLLASTTTTGSRDDDYMIGLPDFQLGEFEDNLWSLEDLCLHQQCSSRCMSSTVYKTSATHAAKSQNGK